MTGFRFYLEFPSATAKHNSGRSNQGHAGNVFAAYTERPYRRIGHDGRYVNDGVGAVLDEPNSPVASCAAHNEWLRKKCKRIPETLARQIHPALFACLDSHEVSA